jgi:hypothetical protein
MPANSGVHRCILEPRAKVTRDDPDGGNSAQALRKQPAARTQVAARAPPLQRAGKVR